MRGGGSAVLSFDRRDVWCARPVASVVAERRRPVAVAGASGRPLFLFLINSGRVASRPAARAGGLGDCGRPAGHPAPAPCFKGKLYGCFPTSCGSSASPSLRTAC